MSEPEASSGRAARRVVEPVQVDGFRAVAAGTIAWAVALVALLPFTDSLREDGRLWWIATCACGVALGGAGMAYLRRKRP